MDVEREGENWLQYLNGSGWSALVKGDRCEQPLDSDVSH